MVQTDAKTANGCNHCGTATGGDDYCRSCLLECDRCGEKYQTLREIRSTDGEEQICYWCTQQAEQRGGWYIRAPDGERFQRAGGL